MKQQTKTIYTIYTYTDVFSDGNSILSQINTNFDKLETALKRFKDIVNYQLNEGDTITEFDCGKDYQLLRVYFITKNGLKHNILLCENTLNIE